MTREALVPDRQQREPASRWQAFYEIIARIPFGRVATYGQIAALAGYPRHARQVGYALAATPDHLELPWHRVINAQGRVSPRSHSKFHEFQEELLRHEGIELVGGRVDLEQCRWNPDPGEV